MKKIILSLLCILLFSGCGQKETNSNNDVYSNSDKNEDVISSAENDSKSSNENVDSQNMHESYIGVRGDGKKWYVSMPYLNEINLGNVYLLANGDDWWISITTDKYNSSPDTEDLTETVINVFFQSMEGYFNVDENGFEELSSLEEEHSGLKTIKIEGTATDGKYESVGECWIYGYVFVLSDVPAGIIGINHYDKSEDAKAAIKMYIDAMVDTLVLK